MEVAEKGTLSRALARGIFAPSERWSLRVARRALVRTLAEVARALLHLHSRGLVHGDLKPRYGIARPVAPVLLADWLCV
eukprot:XP_001696693.1 predicted protein [Chlamydomonas reinhardtii]